MTNDHFYKPALLMLLARVLRDCESEGPLLRIDEQFMFTFTHLFQ